MPSKRTIYIGGDHAAFALKKKIKAFIVELGYEVEDCGPHELNPEDDYPDFVIPAAERVAQSKGSFGIVLGGSGIGECIAANKVKGVRAALAYDVQTAKLSREHNNANVLCLGSRTVTKNIVLVKKIIKTWLATAFSGDMRHVRRLAKIAKYEA